jgi:hypothetical protein
MDPPRPLIVVKLKSKKHTFKVYVFGLFEPFRPRLALKTEDKVLAGKL